MALPIPSMPAIDPKRIRTYFNRLPLATRLLIAALLGFYVLASFVFPWFSKWAMLTPNEFELAESMFPSGNDRPCTLAYTDSQCTG